MKYNIGDVVWFAEMKRVERSVVCPDCFGHKYLTVIKGDGEQVTIDCEGCSRGYEPPRGYVLYNEFVPCVLQVRISQVQIEADAVYYGHEEGFRVKESELFDNEIDAHERAKVLADGYNKEQLANIHKKDKHNKTWSWNVCYYQSMIRKAKKDIEYYTKKLNVAKVYKKDDKINGAEL